VRSAYLGGGLDVSLEDLGREAEPSP
jgi:hypothetical protein